jgi:uncharacterized protein YdeI (BOF family)
MMKMIALAAAMASLFLCPVLLAAIPAPRYSATLQQQSQDQKSQTPQAKTFTGTISKEGDSFVLKDDAGKTSYQLDDQQTASKFEGKRVKVTGTLDEANNTIRVQSIEEASA